MQIYVEVNGFLSRDTAGDAQERVETVWTKMNIAFVIWVEGREKVNSVRIMAWLVRDKK